MPSRLLVVLHWLGLTNLSDDEVRRFVLLKRGF